MSAAAAPINGRASPRAVELDSAGGPPATVLVRGARLLDPRSGLNGVSDVLVRDGRIAEISATLDAPDGAEVVEAEGLHAFPAFVDPHVHLRTPGREDEEDIDSGTRAAAAGGFCAILAQPNTEPGGGLGAGAALAARAGAGGGADSHRLHGRDHRRPGRRAAHGDGRARGRGRRRRSPTTGCRCARRA